MLHGFHALDFTAQPVPVPVRTRDGCSLAQVPAGNANQDKSSGFFAKARPSAITFVVMILGLRDTYPPATCWESFRHLVSAGAPFSIIEMSHFIISRSDDDD